MFVYYKPRGSNWGFGAGLGTAIFLGFLVLLGFIPFFFIYLALVAVVWVVIIPGMYLLIIIAAKNYKRRHGHPPTWRLHPDPDVLDFWLDANDIVKIPRRRYTQSDMDRIGTFRGRPRTERHPDRGPGRHG